ncbi:protein kintoun [Adelges cooleyi]|uniref:protein kintoun n=1 Tax=Adelges cooleyi TaxID=133065 RepID=UPI00217FF553|nr:protein kintoun [Adelges cooleyi]
MNDHHSKLEDLDITKQELENIGEALKNEEFRKLLCEYVDEINDPNNRARYEQEIAQYELERGVQVTFIRPIAGYVLKTSVNGTRKVFVNICFCDVIQKPFSRHSAGGEHWSLPHCLSPVRQDYDKSQKSCDVYDVIFHPEALELTKCGKRLKDLVEDTALTMIEKNYNLVLDKTNLKYPKIAFKGIIRPLITRKKTKDFKETPDEDILPGCPYKPPNDRPIQTHDLGVLEQTSLYTVPRHIIKYRSDIDIQEHSYNMHCKMNAVIPKELIVEINLPLLDTSAFVELDVLPRSLKLICQKPSKYKLNIDLPYTILEDDGNATFDKSAKKLIVRLPVLRKEPQLENCKALISEVASSKNIKCENNNEVALDGISEITCNGQSIISNKQDKKTNGFEEHINGHQEKKCNGSVNSDVNYIDEEDVHYILPEHEFIFGNISILKLNVSNVDPSTVKIIVVRDANMISGKFHSMGSGYFPIWYAFCLKIPSESSFSNSNVKILPSDENVILEFNVKHKFNSKEYWFGLDKQKLTVRNIKIDVLKDNVNMLDNGVLCNTTANNKINDHCVHENDNGESKNDVLRRQHSLKENEPLSNNCQCKDKNSKNGKQNERPKKKKGKKLQKSNAIPIVHTGSLPEGSKSIEFKPGSLPVEFNNIKPTIRGILKKSRSLSECSIAEDVAEFPQMFSSSVGNVDTESSEVLDSSFNDSNHRKSVRFNDNVIEKKFDLNLSIAAQSKKHQRRQQRKRNIREYNTPSESETSEPEDKVYGPLNEISESEETSVSESSAGEMSDDNSSSVPLSKITPLADSRKDHKRRKSKSARKNASLAKQASTNSLIFPIEY